MTAWRDAAMEAADWMCERCGRPATNVHHRRPRGMGGTKDPTIHDPSNLVALCGSGTTGCHGWIESNRAQARWEGWLISRHDTRSPADIPIIGVAR